MVKKRVKSCWKSPKPRWTSFLQDVHISLFKRGKENLNVTTAPCQSRAVTRQEDAGSCIACITQGYASHIFRGSWGLWWRTQTPPGSYAYKPEDTRHIDQGSPQGAQLRSEGHQHEALICWSREPFQVQTRNLSQTGLLQSKLTRMHASARTHKHTCVRMQHAHMRTSLPVQACSCQIQT